MAYPRPGMGGESHDVFVHSAEATETKTMAAADLAPLLSVDTRVTLPGSLCAVASCGIDARPFYILVSYSQI